MAYAFLRSHDLWPEAIFVSIGQPGDPKIYLSGTKSLCAVRQGRIYPSHDKYLTSQLCRCCVPFAELARNKATLRVHGEQGGEELVTYLTTLPFWLHKTSGRLAAV